MDANVVCDIKIHTVFSYFFQHFTSAFRFIHKVKFFAKVSKFLWHPVSIVSEFISYYLSSSFTQLHTIKKQQIKLWNCVPVWERGSEAPSLWFHQNSAVCCQLNEAQHESCKLFASLLGAKWGLQPRGQHLCSKDTVGEGQYIRFRWRGSSVQSSAYFTKGFLLVTRSWCHHEGI